MSEQERADIVIVGGGLAGLTAAATLKQDGLDVIVLEADDHLGGRVQTKNIRGFEIEKGGEWIGADHSEIQQLAAEFGLTLIPHRFNPVYKVDEHRFVESSFLSHPKLEKLLESPNCLEESKEWLANTSWLECLKQLGLNKAELEVQRSHVRFSYGRDSSKLSAWNVLHDLQDGVLEKEDSLWIKGGNSLLVEALAKKLGENNLRLNSKAETIKQNGKVEVFCNNGSSFSSDYAIIALPTYAVLDLDFLPDLPMGKKNALNAVSYVPAIKMELLFRNRFWYDNFELLQNDSPDALYYASQGQEGEGGVLTAYAVHENASSFNNLGDSNRRKLVSHLLIQRFSSLGISVPNPAQTEIHYWNHAFSSYDREDYYNIIAELDSAWIRAYFAGEHMPPEFKNQGYMNGAVSSGRRAAQQILQLRNFDYSSKDS